MLLLAISCCFSSGICWSWRWSFRNALANEDLSSVISSSCACSRTSISESLSGNSALLPADTSSVHIHGHNQHLVALNHCYERYIAFRERSHSDALRITWCSMTVLGPQMQNNTHNEIQPNRSLLISLTVLQTGHTICGELQPIKMLDHKCKVIGITHFAYKRKAETKFPCLSHAHRGGYITSPGIQEQPCYVSRLPTFYSAFQLSAFHPFSYPVDRQIHIMVPNVFFFFTHPTTRERKLLLTFIKGTFLPFVNHDTC